MLPLEIKISGLYSYIEEQTIDFTELTNAGLFGIFGKIGSGKSSILDVMCFAIYKQTERLNVSGDNRYYNMMNLKCNKANASFKFQAGTQNTIYEIQFSLNRNKNNFEDVSLSNHSFFRVEGVNMIPITQSEVSTAVGISYDNFKRTIIIPQGKFKDFIELGDTDRTKMMKELFNLHRFDLSGKVSVLEKNNTETLNKLGGELSTFESISEELIKTLEDELQELNIKFNKLKDNSKIQIELVKNLEDLKNWVVQITAKRNSLTYFQTQESEDQKREIQLNEYEAVSVIFKNLFSEISNLRENLKTDRDSVIELYKSKGNCEEKLEKCNSDLKIVNEKKSKIDAYKEKINDFESLIQLKSELLNQTEIQSNINVSKENLKDTLAKIKNLTIQKQELQKKNHNIEENLISEVELEKTKNWFEYLNNFKNNEKENIKKKISIQSELDSFKKDFDLVFQSELKEHFKTLKKGYSLLEFNKTISQISTDSSKQLNEKREELTHLKVQEELVKFSTNLEDGKPCDLCGSIHHPNPLSKEFLPTHLEDVKNKITEIEDLTSKLNKLSNSIQSVFANQENKQEELEKIKVEFEKFQNQKNEYIKKAPNVTFNENDEEKFNSYFDIAIKQHNQLKQDKKEISTLEGEIEKDQKQKDDAQSNINIFNIAIASVEGKIALYRKGLKHLKESDYNSISIEELKINKATLQEEINKIEEDFKILTERSQKLNSELIKLNEGLNFKKKDVEKNEKSLSDKNTMLSNQLTVIKKTESEIQSILSLNLNAQVVRNSIMENRKKFNMLQGEIKTLESQINNRVFNEEEFKLEFEKLKEISEDLNKVTENKGRVEAGIEETKLKLKEKKILQKKYKEIELRGGNLKTLKRMFMSNGFVNFMSIRYLYNIVELANVRFQKMTKQQFKLTLKGKENAFYVVDFLNGGKERSIKSLGGGQTFQACLALALALSENIQKLAAIDQQFFFLDEGFGTLDKSAIELVFETLKLLKNENRVVGLISHVEDLQQEMDIFLRIENNAEKGTIVKTSWN